MSLRQWIANGGLERAERERRKVVQLPVPRQRFEGWYVRVSTNGVAHAVFRAPDGCGSWHHVLGCRLAAPGEYTPARGRRACRLCARTVEELA